MLEMVQGILSDMDSDEINAIGDTVESEQVAWVIEQTYRNLSGTTAMPEHQELIQLEALSDIARPNYLKLPKDVDKIDSIRYDTHKFGETRQRYRDVTYIDPNGFLDRVLLRDNTTTNTVTVLDFSGVPLLIRSDRRPRFWTSFDDEHIIFDSFDIEVDTTIQESKTVAWGKRRPAFNRHDNDFIPDIDADYFPLFYSEAKLLCFDQFKQTSPAIVAGTAREQKTKMQNDKHRFNIQTATPDYGRRGRVTRKTSRRLHGRHRSE